MKVNMVVGIVGAGSMGAGIAQVAATAGCEVLLYDMSIDVTEKALIRLKKILDRLVEKGRINREKSNNIISNINLINEIEKFKHANLVIEAIVENLEIKKEVFSHI